MKRSASTRAIWRWCASISLLMALSGHALELSDPRLGSDGVLTANLAGAEGFSATSVFVRLASASAHNDRGMDRPEVDLRFSVQAEGAGLVLRVEGLDSVAAGFLVEVFSPNGREILPLNATGSTATAARRDEAPPPDETQVPTPGETASPNVAGSNERTPDPMPTGASAVSMPTGANVVTVQRGETLWAIAGRYQSGSVSTAQLARAIQDANPDAFSLRDRDQILEGSVITIPDLGQGTTAPGTATVTPLRTAPTVVEGPTRRIEDVIANRDARLAQPSTAASVPNERQNFIRQLEEARFLRRQAETEVMELRSRIGRLEAERDTLQAEVAGLTGQLNAATPGTDDVGEPRSMTLRNAAPPARQPSTRGEQATARNAMQAQGAQASSGQRGEGGGMGFIIGLGVVVVIVVGVVATVLGIRRNRKNAAEPEAEEPSTDSSTSNEEAAEASEPQKAPPPPPPPPADTSAYEPPRAEDETAEEDTQADVDEEDDLEDIGLVIADAGTKLALAKAYIDIDDTESAREILDEVVRDGTEKERSEAQALIAKIDG